MQTTGQNNGPPESLVREQREMEHARQYLADAAQHLDSLGINPLEGAPPNLWQQTQTHEAYAGYDPRANLVVKSSGRKAIQILDFVTEATKARINKRKRERITVSEGADGGIKSKAEDTTPPYHTIPYHTMDEYGAANMRLMAFLLKEGHLARSDIPL